MTASSRIGVPDSPTCAVGSTVVGVEFVELVDIAKHLAHLDLQALLLGRRKLQPREARDVPDLFKTDLFLAIADNPNIRCSQVRFFAASGLPAGIETPNFVGQ